MTLNFGPCWFYSGLFWIRMSGGVSGWIQKERQKAGGLGSVQQAVRYQNQDFQALKEECLQNDSLFEDPMFPAEPASLGFKELGPFTAKTRGVEWKRPTVRRSQVVIPCEQAEAKLTGGWVPSAVSLGLVGSGLVGSGLVGSGLWVQVLWVQVCGFRSVGSGLVGSGLWVQVCGFRSCGFRSCGFRSCGFRSVV